TLPVQGWVPGAAWFWGRFYVGVIAVLVLLLRASDEVLLRRGEHPLIWSLGLGVGVSLLFAYDVPRLFAHATDARRARLPLFMTRSFPLDALPPQGRVRVRGTLGEGKQLRGNGVRIAIDVDPERTIVEGGDPVGQVEIIGEIVSAPRGGSYRDAP